MTGVSAHLSKRWYAVHTITRREGFAAHQLTRQGYEVFYPRIARTVRHARQFRSVETSLFPGYLFVQLDVEGGRWRTINGTLGVRSLVMTGDRPVPVPEMVMAELRALPDLSGLVTDIQVGDKVRLMSGPFAGLLGELQRMDGPRRVRVLMDLIGGRIAVNVPKAAILQAS